ncbi:hypothetical protein DFJ73DRAFT_632278 [Zopfochytrium polystomum]|nr:hypothetical protein DFJ73DRAFT_632278 [Zopfochytrium polystomum]
MAVSDATNFADGSNSTSTSPTIIRPLPNSADTFSSSLARAVNVVRTAIDRYGISGVALSFNGGKDCTVLLHLLRSVLHQYSNAVADSSQHSVTPSSYSSANDRSLPLSSPVGVLETPESECAREWVVPTLYVMPPDPFPEVEEFVDRMAKRYNLNVMRTTASMKDGLQSFLDAFPEVKAILLGTRSTDPYSERLQDFSPTDHGWPTVMRVNPVLTWSYKDIWTYLIDFSVPYCCLYDQGYTSLGGRSNTLPNPLLQNPDRPSGYDPARLLEDERCERNGRINRHKKGV